MTNRGRIYDEGDVAEYRDMLTIVRDRVKDAIGKGRRCSRSRLRASRATTMGGMALRAGQRPPVNSLKRCIAASPPARIRRSFTVLHRNGIGAAATAIVAACFLSTGAMAHHSFAMYDQAQVKTLTGKLTRFIRERTTRS